MCEEEIGLGIGSKARDLPLLWPVRHSGAAIELNDVIIMNLMTTY